ncbi:MAG: hypothetical protein AABW92_03825 [Nanoarchaeota archaeon]
MDKKIKTKSLLFGLLGSLVLSLLYLLILSLLNSISHAFSEFLRLWYLMLPLILGFGVQIGLYVYVRESFKAINSSAATASVTASSGVSTASMVACCAHHLTDILPLIGLTFLSTILIRYQVSFILLGVLSNLIGITIMLNAIQKNSLHKSWKGIFRKIMNFDMKITQKYVTVLSIVIFSLSLYFTIIGG